MFEWLFGRKEPTPPPLPPTEKQLNYARMLKLAVPPDVTRDELSGMLADADAENPNLRHEREQKKEKQREKKYGPELIAEEKKWEELSNQNKWLAVVYKSGKSIKAEVLRLNGAYITDGGKLKVESEAGKIVKDRHIGYVVEPGRYVELDPAKLLWSQVVDDFDISDVSRFQATLKQAELVASRMG